MSPLLTILILAMLLMTVIAPFAALSMLMLVLVVAGVGWAVSLLLQAAVGGGDPQG